MKYDLPVKYEELHWSQRREVREQYIEEQKGLCYYCRKPLYEEPHKNRRINPHLFPKTFSNILYTSIIATRQVTLWALYTVIAMLYCGNILESDT